MLLNASTLPPIISTTQLCQWLPSPTCCLLSCWSCVAPNCCLLLTNTQNGRKWQREQLVILSLVCAHVPSTICSQISYLLSEHMCMCVCGCLQLLYIQMFSCNENQNVFIWFSCSLNAQCLGLLTILYKRVGSKAWKRKLVSCRFSPFFSEIPQRAHAQAQ